MDRSVKLYSVLKSFEKLNLSLTPTPLNKLETISRQLCSNIYCKRDDLTGFAFGGNKTRKLDYLIKDAIMAGADSIVTFGSNQSNWCRMTASAGAVNGLEVYLILAGRTPEKPTANLLLDHLSGAFITHIDTEDEVVLINSAMRKAAEITKAGKKPYYIAVGGSNAIGSLGYIRAFAEILEHSEKTGIEFSKIIVASGSAGTQAGMVAGKVMSGWDGSVIGMAVSRNSNEQEENVCKIAVETLELTGVNYSISELKDAVIVDDNYLGEGYRRNTDECLEAIEMFARMEGIFLDEVYTGKAAAGLVGYARSGKIKADENILFVHTGGSVQLFE
ncbi:MAG TPA: D-cysteine desulfhydrase family protein [Bacteroidales bacterium]|nr:D-cysteine desulfhydrase family protein [Bacteroidales bacterium]